MQPSDTVCGLSNETWHGINKENDLFELDYGQIISSNNMCGL